MNNKERMKRYLQLRDYVEDAAEGEDRVTDRMGNVSVHGDRYRHFMIKAAVFKVLTEAGHDVATELTIPGGGTLDVVDLHTFRAYEVETGLTTKGRRDKVRQYLADDAMGRYLDDIHFLDVDEAPDGLDALEEWVADRVVI